VCVCVCVCVRACVRACVRVCARARAHLHMNFVLCNCFASLTDLSRQFYCIFRPFRR